MVYEPLGGRDRFWLSVPALFGMNCLLHYDFSENLYGYRAVSEWNKAFAVMGTSMALIIFSENVFLKRRKKQIVDASVMKRIDEDNEIDSSNVEDSVYWKVWSFGLFHASMMATLYIVKDKALILNLDLGCDTILFNGHGLDVKI